MMLSYELHTLVYFIIGVQVVVTAQSAHSSYGTDFCALAMAIVQDKGF